MLVVRFGISCYFLSFDGELVTQFSFSCTTRRSFSSHNYSSKIECACTNVPSVDSCPNNELYVLGQVLLLSPKSTTQVLLYKILGGKNKCVYSSTKTKQEVSFYSMHKGQTRRLGGCPRPQKGAWFGSYSS